MPRQFERLELAGFDPAVILVPAELNTGESLAVLDCLKESGDISPLRWPDIVIALAHDEQGKRLFRPIDRGRIVDWPWPRFKRVADFIRPIAERSILVQDGAEKKG